MMRLLSLLFACLLFAAVVCGLKDETCGLPHSADGNGQVRCMAYMPRWSYNSDANECVDFVYGGCGGNANRFESREDCEAKCLE